MKTFKRIALFALVAVATLCAGIFAAACTGEATEYNVTVYYSDGTTAVDGNANNYELQLCNQETEVCLIKTYKIGADGKVAVTIAELKDQEATYILHVLDMNNNMTALESKSEVTVNKTNATAKIVLKLDAPAK